VSSPGFQRPKELFQAALARAPESRAAFLADACGSDAALRSEVERLLAAHDRAGGFLSGPIGLDTLTPEVAGEPQVGPQRIGPYRILDTIAHGGMGTVYRAVRDDDSFRKTVALKVVRGGRHSEYFAQRFRQERQILAQLQHPNIATVLDGGTAEDGQPYLVMEYVEGQPITEFCAAQRFGIRERVALFRTVCDAVQYAHQNLVVHRDIKPANVLVDDRGVPKLLDFGIAKLLASGVDPDVAPTATVLPMMTPDYASPEQVRGETVTTSSDVYSLGVLLYELLAGRRPYEVNADSLEDIVHAVCETEPAPPSQAAAPAGLPRPSDLRGDLDTIVLKALRKDPARRYASARELSEDLQRYLVGLPVRARADTISYRAGKFIRRHRVPVAAGALLALSLVAGATATLWQARRAEEQRARAERRFQDVRRTANSFLFEFHDAIADIPGTTRARELVVRRALEYLDSLVAEGEDDDTLRAELAAAYEKVGAVQGLPYVASLGDTAGALSSFQRAYSIRADLVRRKPDDVERLAGACGAGVHLGRVLLGRSDVRAAATHSREFMPLCEEAWRRRPDLGRAPEAFRARILAGDIRFRLGELAEARALFDGVIAQAAVAPRADRPAVLAASQAFDRLSQIAEVEGDVPAAVRFRRRCIEIDETFVQADTGSAYYRRGLGDDYSLLAVLLAKTGDHAAALAAADRASAIFELLGREDPNDARAALDVAGIQVRRSKVLREAGRAAAALATLAEARTRAEDALRRSPDSTEAMVIAAEALDEMGASLMQMRRFGEAVPALQRSLAMREAVLERDPRYPMTLHAIAALHRALGAAHRGQGALGEACRSYARALEMMTDLRARGVPPIPTPQQIDELVRERAPCAGDARR
jgi:non-specific serine/threonine protein kinase/serine/threonine-protein kinase